MSLVADVLADLTEGVGFQAFAGSSSDVGRCSPKHQCKSWAQGVVGLKQRGLVVALRRQVKAALLAEWPCHVPRRISTRTGAPAEMNGL